MREYMLREAREYRDKLGFQEAFNVVLLAGYSEKDGATIDHFKFYDSIVEKMLSMGKTTFLPHKHLINRSDNDSLNILSKILLPESEIILEYDGVYSRLCISARNRYLLDSDDFRNEGKKIIHLYELDTLAPGYSANAAELPDLPIISYKEEKSLDKILEIVIDFYNKLSK